MAGTDFVVNLARTLREVLRPLEEAVATPDTFRLLLLDHGWRVAEDADDPVQVFVAALGFERRLADLVEALDGRVGVNDLAMEDALDTLDAAIALFAVLHDLTTDQPTGPTPLDRPEFWRTFPVDLAATLFANHLELHHPALFASLLLAGVIELQPVAADRTPGRIGYTRIELRWERLSQLIADPAVLAAEVYGWGGPLDHEKLTARLERAAHAFGIPASRRMAHHPLMMTYFAADNPALDRLREVQVPLVSWREVDGAHVELGLSLLPIPPADQPRLAPNGLLVSLYAEGDFGTTIPAGGLFELELAGGLAADSAVGVELRPGSVTPRLAGAPAVLDAGAILRGAPLKPWLLVGGRDTSRVEVADVAFGLQLQGSATAPDLRVVLGTTVLRAVLDLAGDDDFLSLLLEGKAPSLTVGLTLVWSSRHGLILQGSGSLAVAIATSIQLGRVKITQLEFEAVTSGSGLAVGASARIEAELGPVLLSIDGAGVELGFQPLNGGPPGAFGDLDLSLGSRPPRGAGMVVAAGPVSGGGFVGYDEGSGRYSGALALRLQQVSVRAVGVLDTRLPGGQPGFSLLVMLSARFFPGIQLGFGVTLIKVGGLVGVNRRIDVDALHERYASGTARRLLSSEDPLRDLPAALTELDAVFPPAERVCVVGPTLQLQWAKIVTLDVGVFLEFPGPTRAVVLGTAQASVENPLAEGPLLRLRCDFVGVLDLVHSTFAFDAVLVNSRLLETFPVTGGLMLRASWGAEPYTLFSAGGFHPEFAPGSLVVPRTLTRLALSSGSADSALRLRLEGYFAITPNTVQFGASAEVVAQLKGDLRVRGFFQFDALIRLEPFHFEAPFSVGMQVQWRGRTFAGITVSGTLSGPGPVRFTARACIEVMWIDICASKTFELGSDAPPTVSPVSSALDVLAAELRDPANLRATGEDVRVSLRPLPSSPRPVLPPTGIVWEQTRAPLGLLLERFEGSPLRRVETITASGAEVSGEELDWFAPGSFTELTEAEALTRRSFERLPSGVRLGTGPDAVSIEISHPVEVEEIRLPAPEPPRRRAEPLEAPRWLVEAALVREGRLDGGRRAPEIEIRPELWQVLDLAGQPLAAATGEAQAHQLARAARNAVAVPVGDLLTLTDL
ncbi:hypothetical protein SAMN05660657_04403 [Geodermatophilus amargosae]|uniref:DUF6603 domain-containing protein n=1 Tax=Geodermatophilus amargosae TaxID=1296565 RepID=A0A1I7CFJ7_9ACTN|nr:DUF6603 domain-containing protein [Geodermatophilus amargosae]SFT98173.1 hypothetical protein SAMN05660657_04403 [Geodermatophilus amargosae]